MKITQSLNMTKIRKFTILLMTLFLMFLFYPTIEEVILVSEENRGPRDFIKSSEKNSMELFISKVDNMDQFKSKIAELSKKLNVDFYFTNYDTGNKYVVSLYALFSSQESLDVLPITPHINLDTFNTLDYAITNNWNQGPYRINILPTTKYEHRYHSFFNYTKSDLVGESIISGGQEEINLFLKDLEGFEGVVFSYRELIDYALPQESLLFLQFEHFFLSLTKNYSLQSLFLVTLLLTSISVYLQKRRLSIFKMHGY